MIATQPNAHIVLCDLFADRALFERALHHRSLPGPSNKRLEWLGDAVLGLIVREYLYRRYPDGDEGVLSLLSQSLVANHTLEQVARSLNIEVQTHQSLKDEPVNLYADALEAIIGALYLDRGLEYCREHVLRWMSTHLDSLPDTPGPESGKTPIALLKEYLEAHKLPQAQYTYQSSSEGQLARACCVLKDGIEISAESTAASRALAKQSAALGVLEKLRVRS